MADHVARLRSELGEGKVAVIGPAPLLPAVRASLARATGIALGTADDPLDAPVALLHADGGQGSRVRRRGAGRAGRVAGDATVGLRALYVALTRATRFLAIVHHRPLPEPLRPFAAAGQASESG